jgi:hypothetical protein
MAGNKSFRNRGVEIVMSGTPDRADPVSKEFARYTRRLRGRPEPGRRPAPAGNDLRILAMFEEIKRPGISDNRVYDLILQRLRKDKVDSPRARGGVRAAIGRARRKGALKSI